MVYAKWHENRWSRRRALGVMSGGLTGAAALSIVGCGGDESATSPESTTAPSNTQANGSDEPKVGGTYTWAWQGTPHLDPHQDNPSGGAALMGAMYNRLLRYADSGPVAEADLAATLPEQPDETTLTFTLNPGVHFHDKEPVNGRAMTAADVAFSLNRARTDDPLFVHRGELSSIDTIEAIDDSTVQIRTKFPNAILLTILCGTQYIVLAPETEERFGDIKRAESAIGTGSFMMDSFSTDQGATMVRNPNYWRTGKPYLEQLKQITIGDHWSQLLAGNIQTATLAAETADGFSNFDDVLADAKVDGYVYQTVSIGTAQGHWMNSRIAPFNDLRVRQALNLLLDRNDQLIYGYPVGGVPSVALGIGPLLAGFGLTEGEVLELPGYRSTGRDDDVRDGLALLEQAGFTADKPLIWEIMGWSVPHRTIGIDQLQLAQEMYRRESRGALQPTAKGLEWGTWKQAESLREFQMISSAYSMGADAHIQLQSMYLSTSPRNYAGLEDTRVDDMLMKEQAMFDNDERKEAIREIIKYVHDERRVPNLWTGTGPSAVAARSELQGIPPVFDYGKVDQLYRA